MRLSPRPFGFRSVVRLGVFYPERRPLRVAIRSVRTTAHSFDLRQLASRHYRRLVKDDGSPTIPVWPSAFRLPRGNGGWDDLSRFAL
jgi:hypothetical protein